MRLSLLEDGFIVSQVDTKECELTGLTVGYVRTEVYSDTVIEKYKGAYDGGWHTSWAKANFGSFAG